MKIFKRRKKLRRGWRGWCEQKLFGAREQSLVRDTLRGQVDIDMPSSMAFLKIRHFSMKSGHLSFLVDVFSFLQIHLWPSKGEGKKARSGSKAQFSVLPRPGIKSEFWNFLDDRNFPRNLLCSGNFQQFSKFWSFSSVWPNIWSNLMIFFIRLDGLRH